MTTVANNESLQDLIRVRAFIDTHEWRFAKTMPQIPHWYCLLKDKGDVDEFRWFAGYIREHSVPGQFYGKTYYYYYLDGYKYWWMDATAEECDLINRDKVVSIFDFNPTREELCLLFHPKLADRTVEEYLDGRSQVSLYRDVAALFHIRGNERKMRYYLKKTTPELRMDFLNSIGGF